MYINQHPEDCVKCYYENASNVKISNLIFIPYCEDTFTLH